MKIGIDARLINETGVGRYIRNLLNELAIIDTTNQYVVYLTTDGSKSYTPPNERFSTRLVNIRWHTIAEQFILPKIFVSDRLDILHVPYFTIPIFYPGKMVVTIHDLTVLHVNTGRASTLSPLVYKLKKLAYFIVLSVGLIKAKNIIAVSEFTKAQIVQYMHIPQEKIHITYEGYDRSMHIMHTKNSIQPTKPYILYVGNAYPHKNIDTLLSGFEKFLQDSEGKKKQLSLVLVGPDDIFYKSYKQYVVSKKLSGNVLFYGQASYQELCGLYKNADALVFPSLMEGFGLPGVEAMSLGVPVIASNIPVFHEVYGDNVTYFETTDPLNLKCALEKVLGNEKYRDDLRMRAKKFVERYSWRRMAKETRAIYLGT